MNSSIRRSSPFVAAAAFTLTLFVGARDARADFVTFSASGQGGLSASVTFATEGNHLLIALTNTSMMDVTKASQVLTGVFFNGPGALAPLVAVVAPGSSVFDATWLGEVLFPIVSGEFAYAGNLSLDFGADSGISSAGLGIFGPSDLFPVLGLNLAGPWSPNGIQYGITSAGDNPATGNGGIDGQPLIQNSVVFLLAGWCEDWSLSQITNVFFQYGTSLNEPRLAAVPEPGTIALLTVGLVGMAFAARKFAWL